MGCAVGQGVAVGIDEAAGRTVKEPPKGKGAECGCRGKVGIVKVRGNILGWVAVNALLKMWYILVHMDTRVWFCAVC